MTDFSFRVMSYNIHSGIGMDGKVDYDRMANVIAEAGADLTAVQEVAVDHPKAPGTDPLRVMGEKLNRRWVFGKSFSAGTSERKYDYGLGVLGIWEMKKMEVFPLPCLENVEPRIALVVRVNAPVPFYFICTHLSFGMTPAFDRIRLEQDQRHSSARKGDRIFPRGAGGRPQCDTGKLLHPKSEGRLDASRFRRIDLSFRDPVHQNRLYRILAEKCFFLPLLQGGGRNSLASDHRPVVAELTLKREW